MRSRDAEIARLCVKLESGANLEHTSIVRMDEENAVTIAQLNHQVGVLPVCIPRTYGLAMYCVREQVEFLNTNFSALEAEVAAKRHLAEEQQSTIIPFGFETGTFRKLCDHIQ